MAATNGAIIDTPDDAVEKIEHVFEGAGALRGGEGKGIR